jgi:hypothetical protein
VTGGAIAQAIEVINAGLVSATTAESLVRFYLKVVDLSPDMIAIYEGFNDIAPRVFNGFRADYYHFRKTPGSISGGSPSL